MYLLSSGYTMISKSDKSHNLLQNHSWKPTSFLKILNLFELDPVIDVVVVAAGLCGSWRVPISPVLSEVPVEMLTVLHRLFWREPDPTRVALNTRVQVWD